MNKLEQGLEPTETEVKIQEWEMRFGAPMSKEKTDGLWAG